jgi:predicted O-linked N-acetylglucosamine transferase (SPINDLY family)
MNEEFKPNSQAYQLFLEENYDRATELFAQDIEMFPDLIPNYWYLGLVLLLQGLEADAQMTWMEPFLDADLEQAQIWTNELVAVLLSEVERQRSLADLENCQHLQNAWAICQHIREIDPENAPNLLHLIQLSLDLDNLEEGDELLSQITDNLKSGLSIAIPNSLVRMTLEKLLNFSPLQPLTFQFAIACQQAHFVDAETLFNLLFARMEPFRHSLPLPLAIEYGELCHQLQPECLAVIANLTNWYQNAGRNLASAKLAQNMLAISDNLVDRIAANYLITRGFMQAGGCWAEASKAYQEYVHLVRSLIQSNIPVDINHILNLTTTGSFAFYFDDRPQATHQFLRELGDFTQTRIQQHFRHEGIGKSHEGSFEREPNNFEGKSKIRVGYLSQCLRRHSVGWISRWLLHYHDRDRFEIYAYSLVQTNDNVQQFISHNCTEFRHLSLADSIDRIADQIKQDRIDILVDLDSLTSNHCYSILALRPAPIQVTWLGMDAPELPTIDYFIADPYVLPKVADGYYDQKIWRLPQTYVAVNGFEVAVPSLRRQHLDIPQDAVIYLSCQTAVKRHPDTARLQLKIIKSVPNSYFLIKGCDELEVVQQFFMQIALEEGVSCDRLRFLPEVPSEEIHRANLGFVDIVLDTYPYNGATTTLETLWMGIPLVTKVGEQFAARNTYTMMMNAGVTDGIAWTDEEYINWGVQLGTDPQLRQKISHKLHSSRQIAPLWNAKAFTQDMENAYVQMWQKHMSGEESRKRN